MSALFTPTIPVTLSLNLNDGNVSQYPRASVFQAGSLVTTVDLVHDSLGRYIGPWTPPAAVDYDVVFIVYSDAARTIESPIYTREQEKWQPGGASVTAAAVWSANLSTYAGPGNAAEHLARLTAIRAAIIDAVGPTTELTLKILKNELALADGDTGNWVLLDDDDVTVLLTFNVSDKDGNPIVQPVGAPSRRTRGV